MPSCPGTDREDAVSAALLADLRAAITSGRVLTAGPEYVRSVTLFNAAVDIRLTVACGAQARPTCRQLYRQPVSTACRSRYAVADTTSGRRASLRGTGHRSVRHARRPHRRRTPDRIARPCGLLRQEGKDTE